jgi:hypothetical protein
MQLTDEEEQIAAGERGPVLQKALRALVRYGEVFGAKRLVPCGSGHVVVATGALLFVEYHRMLREVAAEGLAFRVPTTANPRAYDPEAASPILRLSYPRQRAFDALLERLGCAPAFTCTPYLAGNAPTSGEVVAWAETNAVAYANSVLAARTNPTPALVDMLCALLGRAPDYGLLGDEGRLADCRVIVRPGAGDDPGLLGLTLGRKIRGHVVWIEGIDYGPDELKEMSATANCSGLLPLLHVAGVTPEARAIGERLVRRGAAEAEVTRDDVAAVRAKLSAGPERPTAVVIGCPHLSAAQLTSVASLLAGRRARVPLSIAACDAVWRSLDGTREYEALVASGAALWRNCALAFHSVPRLGKRRVLTNSAKLAYHIHARYAPTEQCIEAALGR